MLLGATSLQAQNITQDQSKIILRISTTGGLCPYAQCHSELLVYDDGTGTFKEGSQEKQFTINSKELNELLTLIEQANFEDLRKIEFTNDCPTAYDSKQFIYSFLTKHGEEILDSCKNVLNEETPLLKSTQEIQSKAYNSVVSDSKIREQNTYFK